MNRVLDILCKAILFDMDGTLVDSTAVVERGWKMWGDRHDVPLEEILTFSHGRPGRATMEHFLPGRDHTADLKDLVLHEETHLEGIFAVPGAIQFVHAIKRHPWAVVTSAWRKLAEARLVAAGLPLPEVIVSSDEICRGKPDPEGFVRAANRLGVEAEHCLVFEDTRPGIDAGLSAGMKVVGLLTTLAADDLKHDCLIRDFNDVTLASDSDFMEITVRCSG
jgi:mannitol-1-/sugar-/sorbitol-6-phosphatase